MLVLGLDPTAGRSQSVWTLGIPVPFAVAVSADAPVDPSWTRRSGGFVVRALARECARTFVRSFVRLSYSSSLVWTCRGFVWVSFGSISTTRLSFPPTSGRGSSLPCVFQATRCTVETDRSFERRRSPSRIPPSSVPPRFRFVSHDVWFGTWMGPHVDGKQPRATLLVASSWQHSDHANERTRQQHADRPQPPHDAVSNENTCVSAPTKQCRKTTKSKSVDATKAVKQKTKRIVDVHDVQAHVDGKQTNCVPTHRIPTKRRPWLDGSCSIRSRRSSPCQARPCRNLCMSQLHWMGCARRIDRPGQPCLRPTNASRHRFPLVSFHHASHCVFFHVPHLAATPCIALLPTHVGAAFIGSACVARSCVGGVSGPILWMRCPGGSIHQPTHQKPFTCKTRPPPRPTEGRRGDGTSKWDETRKRTCTCHVGNQRMGA